MNSLRLKARGNTFKSYVDLGLGSQIGDPPSPTRSDDGDSYQSSIRTVPDLLPGEVVIAQADNVLKFNILSELKTGMSGSLVCTTFKLSFITSENFPSNQHQQNLLVGENEICLINIDCVYHVANGRKKKLVPGVSVSTQTEIIEIHCKDFRVYTFSFKFSPVGSNKQIINAILYHAFVPKVQLLFFFDYLEHIEEDNSSVTRFTAPTDWKTELNRSCCSGWRVTQVNEDFQLCESLPESFVVPANLLDKDLSKAAPHFVGHRVPTWSWGLPSGCALVRMASIDPAVSESREEAIMVEAVSQAHPGQHPARVIDVEANCPSIKEIQSSFQKFRELCMPSTPHEFWEEDSHYLSALESTHWLQSVSSCLHIALQVAIILCQNRQSVIIQENESRDLNCVVASLVQILLDPFCRTQLGFQHLIQKEWVALGHNFAERLRHINISDSEESPVFLLFLDCVWQLMNQCPSAFEFSETYLTTIWDSAHISVFDTFLFSSQKQLREAQKQTGKLHLHSVWTWSQQFPPHNTMLFRNPLYILNSYRNVTVSIPPLQVRPCSIGSARETKYGSQRRPLRVDDKSLPNIKCNVLENLLQIDPSMKSLKVWDQCYLRWIPLAQVVGGGTPILYLYNVKLCDEIKSLEGMINSLSCRTKQYPLHLTHRRVASDDYVFRTDVNFHNMRQDSYIVTSSFPFSPLGPWNWHTLHAVPSSSCLQVSFCSDDELLDE